MLLSTGLKFPPPKFRPRYLDYEGNPLNGIGSGAISDETVTGTFFGPPNAAGAIDIVAVEPLQQRASARLSRVVDGWLTLLPDAARSWGRLEQFLEFMEGVGYMGDRERDLLVNRRMVCRLCDFFLQASIYIFFSSYF